MTRIKLQPALCFCPVDRSRERAD